MRPTPNPREEPAPAMSQAQNSPGFIHLRVHSAYSLLEGALPIKALLKLAKADNQPALALTDRNNLFGALEFSEIFSEEGIQPITGCTLAVAMPEQQPQGRGDAARRNGGAETPVLSGSLALLAKNRTGYANLVRLSSLAFLEHSSEAATHIPFEVLRQHQEGLICLSGGHEGPLDRAVSSNRTDTAESWMQALAGLFGDRFYVELQRHGVRDEKSIESQLLTLAYRHRIPIVASNQAFFPRREDYDAHDALICIAEGRYVSEDDRRRLTPEYSFKPREQMMALFADLPEALENTVEIARRCAYRPRTSKPILPNFGGESADEAAELRRQAEEGLERH
jgi:DNA polymerase-3 subunit alpha